MEENMKIGVDIGGSHVAVGLVDDEGKILIKKEKEIGIEDKKNIEVFLVKSIVKYINEILGEKEISINEIELIGIASPGTIKDGIILKATNLELKNFNIVLELQKYFNRKIQIRNDGKCATLAEKYYGSMKKYSDFVYICLGTGIGAGVIINDKLLQPERYEGFELGHIVINKNGIQCSCGRNGCWEQYASMRVLKKSLINELQLNENISGSDLLKLLQDNKEDIRINRIIDDYIENLALGIENIINIFEPQAICIGGSFVYFKEILLEKLENKLKEKNATFNNETIPDIVCADLKNDAGIIGAIL
jgi:glucokinase